MGGTQTEKTHLSPVCTTKSELKQRPLFSIMASTNKLLFKELSRERCSVCAGRLWQTQELSSWLTRKKKKIKMPVCTGGQKCIKSPSEVSPICAAAAAVRRTIRGSPQNVNGRTRLERSKKKRYIGRVHIVVGQYHERNTCLQGLRFEGALSSKAPKRSV